MAAIYVNKADPFDLIEVERLDEPVPDDNPETFSADGEPGRFLTIRYRSKDSDGEWANTTRGVLTRKYRAMNGLQAKALVSEGDE